MSVPLPVRTGFEERPQRLGPWSIVRWSAWFGMISGSLELVEFLLKCHYFDPRNYNVSHHFPWMYPVAGILILGGPGLVLAVGAWLRPMWCNAATTLRVLLFVMFLGLLFRCPLYTLVCLLLAAGLALRIAPWLAARAERFDLVVRRSLVVLTLLLAATALVCYGRPKWVEGHGSNAPPRRTVPNVLLIVLDTVRAESLSLYGYERDTTPNLTRLSARGVRFDRAYSAAPWTAPSHASMFTGRWCHELSVNWNRPLDATPLTLAEFLGARGYATAGFVANTTYCSYETGLARGFAHYEDYDVTLHAVLLCSALVQRTVTFVDKHPALACIEPEPADNLGYRKTAERINGDFLAWLDRSGRPGPARPFFAFLNYFDAHHPYLPPGPGTGPPVGRKPASPADVRLLKKWWDLDKRRLSSGDIALARDSYDRCIAYLDAQLGRLFAELERRGVLDETLVVVTADHGEHFGEQRLFGHGCSLYSPELHVPLLILPPQSRSPGVAGRVVTAPVSLRNLAATIVDATVKSNESKRPFPGCSLFSDCTGPIISEIDMPFPDDPNQGRSPVCRGPLVSLVDGGYHYIRNGEGREELYDLEADPQECHDMARSAEVVGMLRRFRHSLPDGHGAARLSAAPRPVREHGKLPIDKRRWGPDVIRPRDQTD
jgi:arylsulfatase A-like enzyme